MDSQQKNGQAIISCKHCGSGFSCHSDANSGQCWCHDLPNVMPLTEQARTSEDCYCRQCLEEIISKTSTTKPEAVIAGHGMEPIILNAL
jgi:Cysteine-rich CWC